MWKMWKLWKWNITTQQIKRPWFIYYYYNFIYIFHKLFLFSFWNLDASSTNNNGFYFMLSTHCFLVLPSGWSKLATKSKIVNFMLVVKMAIIYIENILGFFYIIFFHKYLLMFCGLSTALIILIINVSRVQEGKYGN